MRPLYSIFNFTILILLLFAVQSNSQWVQDPNVNTQVCDVTGEQVLPKISKTTDGGCYICWFDGRTSGYRVYVQRLNAAGVKQFAADGLLVSSHPQSSSLVDYDMMTDDSNNAVIVFTDTRNGSTITPFAYRISPQGNFLWGADGVNLATDNATFQPNPKVTETSDGNFVIAWIYSSTPNKIAMQKLSPSGSKLWGNDPIYLAGAGSENFTYPALVQSDNGSVIMMWSGYVGSFLNPQNYHLYTQKYSSSGNPVWSSNPDTVYSLGRVNGYYVPKLYSDGNNGAIYAWQDDRNATNIPGSYVQHISSTDVKLFPVNGSAGSTNGSFYHFAPTAAYMPSTGEIYMFWEEVNYPTQSQTGIYGQKFNSTGVRQWTDNGKIFKPMDNNSMEALACLVKDTSVFVYYNDILFGSNNDYIKSLITGGSGVIGWGGSIIEPSSILSPKLKLVETMNSSGMSMLTWSDQRNDGGGIYAQNINLDGTFGNPAGIHGISGNVPDKFALYQNFPNPFNPSTRIKFDIPGQNNAQGVNTSLVVYDILGRVVATLINGNMKPGSYEINWNASSYPSGVYLYKLNSGNYTKTMKMVLVK